MSRKNSTSELNLAYEDLNRYKRMYETIQKSVEDNEEYNTPPCTKDYDMFVMNAYNRSLHWSKALERSMRIRGFLPRFAIAVKKRADGKMEIQSGHNRFAMAKKLGLPVYYIVDNADVEITEIELDGTERQKWTAIDFVNAHANNGKEDFLLLLKIVEKYNIPITTVIRIFCAATLVDVKRGEAKIKNAALGYSTLDAVQSMFANGIAFAKTASFIMAIYNTLSVEEVDAEKLIRNATNNPRMMRKCPDIESYLEEIDNLYNYHTSSQYKIPLKHMVMQKMRERAKNRLQSMCDANPRHK